MEGSGRMWSWPLPNVCLCILLVELKNNYMELDWLRVIKFYIYVWSHCNTLAYASFLFMFLLPSMLGNLPEPPFTLAPSSSRAGSQHRATSSLSQNILPAWFLHPFQCSAIFAFLLSTTNFSSRSRWLSVLQYKLVTEAYFCQFWGAGFYYNIVLHKRGFTVRIARNPPPLSLSLSLCLTVSEETP